jgi:hypothetical protein
VDRRAREEEEEEDVRGAVTESYITSSYDLEEE